MNELEERRASAACRASGLDAADSEPMYRAVSRRSLDPARHCSQSSMAFEIAYPSAVELGVDLVLNYLGKHFRQMHSGQIVHVSKYFVGMLRLRLSISLLITLLSVVERRGARARRLNSYCYARYGSRVTSHLRKDSQSKRAVEQTFGGDWSRLLGAFCQAACSLIDWTDAAPSYGTIPASRKYRSVPGCSSSSNSTLASVLAAVVCAR